MRAGQPIRVLHRLFQGLTLALAAAFLIVWLRPEWIPPLRETVEIRTAAPAGAPTQGPVSYADSVKRAAPAVVNIYTAKVVARRDSPLLDDPVFRFFFGDELRGQQRRRLETSLGSGVIVSPQGHVLTNHHVVDGASEIQALLHDGRRLQARLIGSDRDTDLAVLKLDGDGVESITLGDSDRLQVGDVVLAIGNPFGVGQTVTFGIVSATGRRDLGISTFENFVQTDAAINPGNSGGALIDAHGTLVGINTAIFSRTGGSQGIGFAIPTSLARTVMQQIVEHGRPVRGWLGIRIQELSPELRESFGVSGAEGVLVAAVLRGGPAQKAGIQPGDVILRVADRPVRSAGELLNEVARHAPGTRVDIAGLRDRKAQRWTAEVGERPTQSDE